MVALAIGLALAIGGYLLWKSGKLDAILPGHKTALTGTTRFGTGAPPSNAAHVDPPQSKSTGGQVVSALGYANKLSASGCAAVAQSKKVPAGAANLGCNIYGYLTPLKQAEVVLKYVPGASTATNAVKGAATTTAKAVGSAISKAAPWNW